MHILMNAKRGAAVAASIAAATAVVMLAGCSSSTDTTSMPTPSVNKPAPHVAAAGAAVNAKLKIEQLRLESAIKQTKDKNGLVFFEFKYVNNDGKVYMCVLPAAKAAGEQTASEWLSIFDIYKLPKVLAQKPVKHDNGQGLGDFPFIAPKPQEQAPEQANAPAPTPTPTPPPAPAPLQTTTSAWPASTTNMTPPRPLNAPPP